VRIERPPYARLQMMEGIIHEEVAAIFIAVITIMMIMMILLILLNLFRFLFLLSFFSSHGRLYAIHPSGYIERRMFDLVSRFIPVLQPFVLTHFIFVAIFLTPFLLKYHLLYVAVPWKY
jgi:hypothetical protein